MRTGRAFVHIAISKPESGQASRAEAGFLVAAAKTPSMGLARVLRKFAFIHSCARSGWNDRPGTHRAVEQALTFPCRCPATSQVPEKSDDFVQPEKGVGQGQHLRFGKNNKYLN